MIERLDGRLRGEPMALTTMITAPAPDSLQLAYVDSGHGELLLFTGSSIPGDTIRFSWNRNLETRTLMVRREYSGITAHAFVTQTFMSPDTGRHWILVQRARYERA